jgi:hypothetical protein
MALTATPRKSAPDPAGVTQAHSHSTHWDESLQDFDSAGDAVADGPQHPVQDHTGRPIPVKMRRRAGLAGIRQDFIPNGRSPNRPSFSLSWAFFSMLV